MTEQQAEMMIELLKQILIETAAMRRRAEIMAAYRAD